MEKKEVILLVILTILSIIVTASVYFGLNSTTIREFLGLIKPPTGIENITGNITQENNQTQLTGESNESVNESNQTSNNTLLDALWCKTGETVWISSDIFGEGRGEKIILGVERIFLGYGIIDQYIVCEACHYQTTFEDTERIVDEHTNAPKLRLLGIEDKKEECSRYFSSKTFISSNLTESGNETNMDLIFSNKTLTREIWYDKEGRLCSTLNGFLKASKGAEC